MNIDAVEQWATDALLIAGNGGGGTGTFSNRITVVATGAPVRVTVAGNLAYLGCVFVTFSESKAGGTLQKPTLQVEW